MRTLDILRTVAAVLLAGTAAAQTTTGPATNTTTTTAFTTQACTTSTTTPLQSFSVERVLPLTGFNSSFTPTFPASIQTAVTANALEIREGIAFNPQNQLLTLNLFTVQPGAPLPTPTGGFSSASLFSTLTIKVDSIYTSTGPHPGVMLVGTVATNTPASPFGSLTGSPAVVSIGFTNDTPPKINNLVVVIAGQVVEFSGTGGGTVTFISSPVTPPGSVGGPTITVAPAGPTAIRVVDLDASATTSPNLPLKFHWSVVAGAADIGNADSALATGYILGGAGVYTFRVTVTDSKGNSSTQDVNVQFR
jgi:hypothetical protein